MKKTHLLGLCVFLGLTLSLMLFTNATKVVEKNDTYYRKVLYTNTLEFVLKYAPFKQVSQKEDEVLDLQHNKVLSRKNVETLLKNDTSAGTSEEIQEAYQTQQLGSSCEAMRFLIKAYKKPQYYLESTKTFTKVNGEIKDKIYYLLHFVQNNQYYKEEFDPELIDRGLLSNEHYKNPQRILYGGIRSYPAGHSFYPIDAALCGVALVEFYKKFKNEDKVNSDLALSMSKRAAIFILNAHNPNRLYLPESASSKIKNEKEPFLFYDNVVWDSNNKPEFPGGVIESIIESTTPGDAPAINNQMHTKLALAAEFLFELNLINPLKDYRVATSRIAQFVLKALNNKSEYYNPKSFWTSKEDNLNQWKRAGDKNQFIFGDTVAYSLRSLNKVKIISHQELKAIYEKYTTHFDREYNPSKCYAGYLRVDSNSEQSIIHDPDSSYYDLVTCGIMLKFKQNYFLNDFKSSQAILAEIGKKLDTQTARNPYFVGWAQKFNGENVLSSDYKLWQDTTTMTNLGEAILETEGNSQVVPNSVKVCGVYFADANNPNARFIQGSWHNDPSITKDPQTCANWIKNAILTKTNCAQPAISKQTVIYGVLLDKEKYSFDLPSKLLNEEIVINKQKCP